MNAERNLKLYLEKGYVTKQDRKLLLFLLFYSFQIAKRVFSKINNETKASSGTTSPLTPAAYTGRNSVIKLIQQRLQESSLSSIKAAIVHGSIGDGNEISYSDLDGILIIDPKEIRSAKHLFELHQLIKKTEELFFKQDALQHHGWAIFLMNDFLDFKDHLFPIDLIQNGKTFYAAKGLSLEVRVSSERDQYQIVLQNLCTSIAHKTSHLSTLKNQYIFKNLLSEIMLLPAAFLQAQYSKTISKKESYSILKSDFPAMDSTILDWASDIRKNWVQDPINYKTQLFHQFKRAGFPISFLAPNTPENIRVQLDESWKNKVITLCNSLLMDSNQSKG
ncbi:MAG: hypothetical protein ACKVQV_03505 [Bacteroidia bacterium]